MGRFRPSSELVIQIDRTTASIPFLPNSPSELKLQEWSKPEVHKWRYVGTNKFGWNRKTGELCSSPWRI